MTEKKNGNGKKPVPAENPIEELERRSDQNLWLWRLNETTSPRSVRPVKIGGREFSSIDSYYQIKRATETFGPVGIGWGWALDEDVIEVPGKEGRTISFAKCRVTIWYIDPELEREGVLRPGGRHEPAGGRGRPARRRGVQEGHDRRHHQGPVLSRLLGRRLHGPVGRQQVRRRPAQGREHASSTPPARACPRSAPRRSPACPA